MKEDTFATALGGFAGWVYPHKGCFLQSSLRSTLEVFLPCSDAEVWNTGRARSNQQVGAGNAEEQSRLGGGGF